MFRKYSIEELCKVRPGTIFTHVVLGKCMVMRKKKMKFMRFKRNTPDAFFVQGDWPWDASMKLEYREF